ncbi:hypothetical protein [Psychrobacter cibarius]|uniref:hypothetical protein n=1 Tax=Psychrobacter cibarius TaxID=282669 RepID=UPI00191B4CCB|nr:hypothetical protein [Psychrobacter cibarius]
MPASSFFRKMQEYGDNPSNGFMDNTKLELIEQKQRLGEPLTNAQKEFLEQKNQGTYSLNINKLCLLISSP